MKRDQITWSLFVLFCWLGAVFSIFMTPCSVAKRRMINRRQYTFVLSVSFLLLFFALLGATTTAIADPLAEAPSLNPVWIMHTNDHHGALEPDGRSGALPQLATVARSVREQARAAGAEVLLLDAGDINTGSPVSDANLALPDILAFNKMGYDAMAIGNHEFDRGLAVLERQMKQAQFPFLSANLLHNAARAESRNADGSARPFARYWGVPYIVKTCGNVKVGVFGLSVANPTIIAVSDPDLVFLNEIETARKMVQELRERQKVDLVIALAHLGILEEQPNEVTSIHLAQQVSGIDLIIDGHSHTAMERPLVVAGTPIVSAHCRSDRLGIARFVPRLKSTPQSETQSVVSSPPAFDFQWECRLIDDSIPPDPEIQKIIDPFVQEMQAHLVTVVGRAAHALPFGDKLPRRQETELGILECDATFWLARQLNEKLDFAIYNGGSIRVGLPQGDITMGMVRTCFSFENTVVFVTLTGNQVIDLFKHVENQPLGSGAFPQVSRNVRYHISFFGNQPGTLTNLTIDRQPVDVRREYRVGLSSYMYNGGNGYDLFKQGTDAVDTKILIRTMVSDYIRQLPQPFEVTTDGHVQVEIRQAPVDSPANREP